jgi:hypothetical protein
VSAAAEPLPTLAASSERALGAYYTPSVPAAVLARFALRRRGDRVLEPSMGSGAVLGALAQEDARRDLDAVVWGVELAADTHAGAVAGGLVDPARAIRSDFFAVAPFLVDAVVGNPPFRRLRHLEAADRELARSAGEAVLGARINPDGNVWLPFLLHATRFLAVGGRLGLVLPYDVTYLRYVRPVWAHLARSFGSLRVVRCHERMFADTFQETVLLLADGFGRSTDSVELELHRSLASLAAGRPARERTIAVDDIVRGDDAFRRALLPDGVADLLDATTERHGTALGAVGTLSCGYVTGDKTFFHPTADVVSRHALPASSLRPALSASRQLRGIGLRTSGAERLDHLFLPAVDPQSLSSEDRCYIAAGARAGVDRRYKCRTRSPWYVTPAIRVPDVVLPVFSERPAMLVNDCGALASNSLLCGYDISVAPETLATGWYSSLTLLQLELEARSLGGGVITLMPREASRIRVPLLTADAAHLDRLDAMLAGDRIEDAFRLGDETVLRARLGVGAADVALLEQGVEELVWWRTAGKPNSRQ